MENIRDYLTKLINKKVTLSAENNKKIKDNYSMSLIDYTSIVCVLNCSLILFGSSHAPNAIISMLIGLFLLFYVGHRFYMFKIYLKGLKVRKKIKSSSIKMEELNKFYESLISKETLSKEEIEIFMDKIKIFKLEDNEMDYCIKKTISEEKLDFGNLLFMIKLYENIEDYFITKSDPILIKKSKIQTMNRRSKMEEDIFSELKEKEFV